MKTAFFSTKTYDRESFEKHLKDFGHEISYLEANLGSRTLSLAEGHGAICSFVNDHITEPMLGRMAKMGIKLVALRCAGYNQINLKAAKSVNIPVVRIPAYSPEAVAEHAFALILTLSRKTHKTYNRIRENNFSLEGLIGLNIHGKTVGVIGTGTIGKAFCRIAKGFGCEILATDLNENE
jgi:D-lactate dehydrogenase